MQLTVGILAVVVAVLVAVIFWGGGPNTQFWGDKSIAGAAPCYMDDNRVGVAVESGVWPFRNEYCKARRNPGPKTK